MEIHGGVLTVSVRAAASGLATIQGLWVWFLIFCFSGFFLSPLFENSVVLAMC